MGTDWVPIKSGTVPRKIGDFTSKKGGWVLMVPMVPIKKKKKLFLKGVF